MAKDNNFLPVKVNVVLSINKEEVRHNISTNLKNIPVWYNRLFYPNGFHAYIISAGPSLEKYVTELNLKERMTHPNRGFVVFCVKHALPRLLKMGVEPDFCVILDGRDFDGISTHGEHRKKLFETIPQKTIFLVASMSNPGYATYLMSNGARVMGWHTQVSGLEEFTNEIANTIVVNGGTSSGTRAISLAHNFGCRKVTLVGFDSCIHNPTEADMLKKDDKGRPKYLPVDLPVPAKMTMEHQKKIMELTEMYAKEGLVYQNSLAKRFYTTGELLAQAQDFEGVFGNAQLDIEFDVKDDGIANHMFKNMQNRPIRDFSFIEYFRSTVPRNNLQEVTKKKVTLKSDKKAAVQKKKKKVS
jgi:uncharacterized Rossmann fold enzyme